MKTYKEHLKEIAFFFLISWTALPRYFEENRSVFRHLIQFIKEFSYAIFLLFVILIGPILALFSPIFAANAVRLESQREKVRKEAEDKAVRQFAKEFGVDPSKVTVTYTED